MEDFEHPRKLLKLIDVTMILIIFRWKEDNTDTMEIFETLFIQSWGEVQLRMNGKDGDKRDHFIHVKRSYEIFKR